MSDLLHGNDQSTNTSSEANETQHVNFPEAPESSQQNTGESKDDPQQQKKEPGDLREDPGSKNYQPTEEEPQKETGHYAGSHRRTKED